MVDLVNLVLDVTCDYLEPAPARPGTESTLQRPSHPESGTGGESFRECRRGRNNGQQVDPAARFTRSDRDEKSGRSTTTLHDFGSNGELSCNDYEVEVQAFPPFGISVVPPARNVSAGYDRFEGRLVP